MGLLLLRRMPSLQPWLLWDTGQWSGDIFIWQNTASLGPHNRHENSRKEWKRRMTCHDLLYAMHTHRALHGDCLICWMSLFYKRGTRGLTSKRSSSLCMERMGCEYFWGEMRFITSIRKWKCESLSHVQLFLTPWSITTRLPCPWESPGKNTGVGWHFLLHTSIRVPVNWGYAACQAMVSAFLGINFFIPLNIMWWELLLCHFTNGETKAQQRSKESTH